MPVTLLSHVDGRYYCFPFEVLVSGFVPNPWVLLIWRQCLCPSFVHAADGWAFPKQAVYREMDTGQKTGKGPRWARLTLLVLKSFVGIIV